MKIKSLLIILLVCNLVLISCANDVEDQNIDIESIFIGQGNVTRGESGDALFALDTDHELVKLNVKDAICNPNHWTGVEKIFDLHNGYALLKYKETENYYYSVKLFNLKTKKAVCVNHEWEKGDNTHGHINMDCNMDSRYFAVSNDGKTIYWTTGANENGGFLNGTRVVKYVVGAEEETKNSKNKQPFDVLAYTTDYRIHGILIDADENILTYPTHYGFIMRDDDGNPIEDTGWNSDVMQGMYIPKDFETEEDIIKIRFPVETYFGFKTPNDAFYVCDTEGIKKVEIRDKTSTCTNVYVSESAQICDECSMGSDFSIIFKKNSNLLYLITNDGVVTEPDLGLTEITYAYAYKDAYYILGIKDGNQVLLQVTNGVAKQLRIDIDAVLKSLYTTDAGLVISGTDSSNKSVLASYVNDAVTIISNQLNEVKDLMKNEANN